MNPNISLSHTDDRRINSQTNPGVGAPVMSSLNQPQQLRPLRMEYARPGDRSTNIYQQNYQPSQQNNNPQHQQLQQNMYQTQQQNYQQQQLNYQRQHQNLRFPSNQDPSAIIQHNNSNATQPNNYKIERILTSPQTKPSGPQQPIRPPLNSNPNNSDIPHQTRAEAPKSPNDQMQTNFSNISQADYYKTQTLKDNSVSHGRKSSVIDLNSHRMSDAVQKPDEPTKSQTKTNNLAESFDEQPTDPIIINSKSEIDEFDLHEGNKKNNVDKKAISSSERKNEAIKKEQGNNNIKDESITIGMVQKNIKFFEENDTTKKPLKPEILIPEKMKCLKSPPDAINRITFEGENESGVDETPVVHPNLRSIFQVPLKVAKIPRVKKSNVSKELKSKRLINDRLNKKRTSSEHICMHFKKRNGKKPKTQIYGSKEELLAFFENTKSWRKLNSREPKINGNVNKDKTVHKATTNGDIPTPKQTPSKLQTPSKRNLPVSPTKNPSSPGTPGAKSLPKTPESPAPPTPLIKKVPMNKIQVGAAPSPNLKTVRSKVGSLANTTHKPGGGNVKIESHKIDLSNVQPRTEAKNEQYKRSGGDKKIQQVKLQWSAKSKIGSLENATYKPGGGEKKIESVKLDFKEKAKPKVGSKENVKHTPGGGNVKIENQKLEFKAQSKVGSLDNVKHKPGGGDIKIFDDKTYLRQISGNSSEGRASGTQAHEDLSVVQQIEERNMSTASGNNTSIKIKKITTLENTKEAPKIKKITEVTVISQRFKKERRAFSTNVKIIYSKIGLPKHKETKTPIEFVKKPAKVYAPVLKPSLSKKDVLNNFGKVSQNQSYENKKGENEILNYNKKYMESIKQIPKSPDLPEGKFYLKDDIEIPKILQDKIAIQKKLEKFGKKEMNEIINLTSSKSINNI